MSAPLPAALRRTLLALLPFVGVALVLVADREDYTPLLLKKNHELIAIPLLGLATVLWLASARRTREPVTCAAALLGIALTCREIHFKGSNFLIFVAVVTALFWGWPRRRMLLAALRKRIELQWYAGALWSYFLSQVVAHRPFKGLPGELRLHVPIEEMLESVGHVVIFCSAVLAWQRARSTAEGAPAPASAPPSSGPAHPSTPAESARRRAPS